jgi:hypothetical protein
VTTSTATSTGRSQRRCARELFTVVMASSA